SEPPHQSPLPPRNFDQPKISNGYLQISISLLTCETRVSYKSISSKNAPKPGRNLRRAFLHRLFTSSFAGRGDRDVRSHHFLFPLVPACYSACFLPFFFDGSACLNKAFPRHF